MAGGTGAAVTVKETGMVTGVSPVPPLSVTGAAMGAGGQGAGRDTDGHVPVPVPDRRERQPAACSHWRSSSRCRRRCC